MPATLEESVAKLTDTIESVAKQTDGIRKEMAAVQSETKSTLDRLVKIEAGQAAGANLAGEVEKINKKLEQNATQMERLASENTNLLEQARGARNQLASMGNKAQSVVYQPVPGGAIFESKRQAIELGYYFMATNRANREAQSKAMRWIKDNQQDLRYLPDIPPSFLQMQGVKWDEIIKRCYAQGVEYGADRLIQDVGATTVPGSALVFPTFANAYIRNVENYGVFRRNATIWPMSGDTVIFPRRRTGLSVYWVGEATAPSETDPTFDHIRLTVKKMCALHQYSREMAEDENAAISFAAIVMEEFAHAAAVEEDRIGFNGTAVGGNSPGFAGFWGLLGLDRQDYAAEGSEDLNKVLRVSAATGLDRTDEVTLKGLRSMVGLCHTWAKSGAKWFMHRTVRSDLEGIETTGGGPITASNTSGRMEMIGYPIEEVESMPASPGTASTGVFAFGNLRLAAVLGDKRAPQVETSEHYAFNTDQLTVRFSERVGIQWLRPTAMVVYVTAS